MPSGRHTTTLSSEMTRHRRAGYVDVWLKLGPPTGGASASSIRGRVKLLIQESDDGNRHGLHDRAK